MINFGRRIIMKVMKHQKTKGTKVTIIWWCVKKYLKRNFIIKHLGLDIDNVVGEAESLDPKRG